MQRPGGFWSASSGSLGWPFSGAGGGAGGGDPSFASVVLLADFDGADGATTATDYSNSANALSFLSNAQLDTGVLTPWGEAGLLLDGTDDAVQVGSAGQNWTFTDDFTIECYFRRAASGTLILFGQSQESNNQSFRVYHEDAAGTQRWTANFWHSGGVYNVQSGDVNTPLSTWGHFAWVRGADETMRLYMDGVQIASLTSAGASNSTSLAALWIGRHSSNGAGWNGHIAGFRITNGVCRYPAGTTFTPPTGPFPRS